MGGFHCPMGAPFCGDDVCIDCGMCSATTSEEKVEASRRIRAYLRSHNVKDGAVRKIAVTGKGGVGKTSLVALMARAMARRGCRPLVFDTDESNPGLYRLLGFDRAPQPLGSLLAKRPAGIPNPASWLNRERMSIADIPADLVGELNGISFLMAGKLDDPFQGCACSLANMARELVEKLGPGDGEVLLVDTEAGTESFGRGVERSVDTVLVVVEPSFESMAVAEKIGYLSEGMGITRVRAVLNKLPTDSMRQKMWEEMRRKRVEPIAAVYFDQELAAAAFAGGPPGDSGAAAEVDVAVGLLLQGYCSNASVP